MEKLWCVHISGSDDLLPTNSKDEAETKADQINDDMAALGYDLETDEIKIEATAIEWPGEPEAHKPDEVDWDEI
jgi:hypothetical protein